MSELLALAERCEKAEGPDRPLSWDIWDALGKPVFDDWSKAGSAPAYTASLDAAMSLVPEGWTFANLSQNDKKGWWCELRQGYLTSYDKVALGRQINNASPALAVCAASLRALSSIETPRG